MKKMISLLLAEGLVLAMSACNNNSTTQTPQTSPSSSPTREPENIATLVADFSGGNSDLVIEQYKLGYSGDLTPEILIDGLSALTGLDFIADAVQTEMGGINSEKTNRVIICDHHRYSPACRV
ncbi:MAG: hypothetical protein GXY05_15290 [Clostridiales bacterium]|nr:hypothetical protein [Clostridiales bacterium]